MATTATRTSKPKATTTTKVAPKKVTNKTEAVENKPSIKKTTTAIKAEVAPKVATKKVTAPMKANCSLTQEVRHRLICERAYFIAESNGFDPNKQMQNWLEAERQIDQENKQ